MIMDLAILMVTFLGWWVHVTLINGEIMTSNDIGDTKVTAAESPGWDFYIYP